MEVSYETPSGRPQLGVGEVERLLEFLRSQRDELRQTWLQRALFRLQAVSTFGYALALVVMGLAAVFEWDAAGMWATGVFVVLLLLSALLVIVNLVLMRRFGQRMRLIQHLGLRALVDSSWRAAKGRRGTRSFWSSLGFILGVLWVGATAFLLLLPYVGEGWGHMEAALLALLVSTPGVLLIAFYLMRRVHRRNALLSDVNLLGNLLHEKKEEAVAADRDAIDFSPGWRRSIQEIERRRIERDRAEAIRQSYVEGPSEQFRVSRSTKSLLAAAELPAAAVAASERLIARLGGDPRPEGARQDGTLWQVRDPETGVEVVYGVDDERKLIKVRDVVASSQAG